MGEIAEFLESKAVAKKIVEDRKKLPDGFLDEEARRVKIGVWVRDLLEKQISKYTLATHVGKFANPDSTVHLYVESKERPDGYLTTENTQCETDIVYTNANIMTAAMLLLYKMEDGQSILEHILNQDGKADELKLYGIDSEKLYQQFKDLKTGTRGFTDKNLRQVYFPIGCVKSFV